MGYSVELQIVSLALTSLAIIATLFAWSWTKGKIEGEVTTKLDIQASDIKELKVSVSSMDISKVKERLAVLEYRIHEIDKQVADRISGRSARTRITD